MLLKIEISFKSWKSQNEPMTSFNYEKMRQVEVKICEFQEKNQEKTLKRSEI